MQSCVMNLSRDVELGVVGGHLLMVSYTTSLIISAGFAELSSYPPPSGLYDR